MTNQEIRDNAPSGATHYRNCADGSTIYYKIDGRYVDVHIGFWTVSALRYDDEEIKPL